MNWLTLRKGKRHLPVLDSPPPSPQSLLSTSLSVPYVRVGVDGFPIFSQGLKGDVTRNDSQRRFLVQHSITTLLQHRFEWLQHCSNIATNRSAALEIVVSNRLVLRSATTRRQRKRQKKKTVGLISKTAISNMHHVFHISLPLLHYCDMKMPHFTFNGERKEAMTKLYFSL